MEWGRKDSVTFLVHTEDFFLDDSLRAKAPRKLLCLILVSHLTRGQASSRRSRGNVMRGDFLLAEETCIRGPQVSKNEPGSLWSLNFTYKPFQENPIDTINHQKTTQPKYFDSNDFPSTVPLIPFFAPFVSKAMDTERRKRDVAEKAKWNSQNSLTFSVSRMPIVRARALIYSCYELISKKYISWCVKKMPYIMS